MDNAIEFRNQMRGYNKADVNNFISRENMRFNKLEESYNRTIKSLELELEELKANADASQTDKDVISGLEQQIHELEAALNVQIEESAEKDSTITALNADITAHKEQLERADFIINELNEQLTAAKAAMPAPQPAPVQIQATAPAPVPAQPEPQVVHQPKLDSDIIEKAEKYDNICDKIDEILAFAKEEADKIIAEAFEMRKYALKRTSTQMKNDISARSDSIIEDLKRTIRRQLKK